MTTDLPPEAVEAAARAIHNLGCEGATAGPPCNWEYRIECREALEAHTALSAALPLLPDVGDLLAELDRLRAATVKPDRDTIARAHVPVDTAFPNPWGCACGKSFRTGHQWSGHVIDAVLAVLPGRTEAQVKAEALREAADLMVRRAGQLAAEWLRARADRIERGEEP